MIEEYRNRVIWAAHGNGNPNYSLDFEWLFSVLGTENASAV